MALKSASRSKKQLPDWARAVESLRLALKVTQAQLAELIGVSAPIVSQWESGARKPSPSVFVRMAKLARDPLAFQFWDFADIHASDVLRLVPEIEARIRAAVASDEDVVRVPLIVDLNQIPAPAIPIQADVKHWIPVPARYVPNPATTSCVSIRKDRGLSIFESGQEIAIIDAAQHDATKLLNQMVVAYLSRSSKYATAGVHVGRLQKLKLPSQDSDAIVLTTLEERDLGALMQLDIHIPGKKGTRVHSMFSQALEGGEILFVTGPDWRILGRVIGIQAYVEGQNDDQV